MKGQPIYQFKVREVSSERAEFMVKDDSNFLKLLELRQTVDINFLSPVGETPSGKHKGKVDYITKPPEGTYQGHVSVGISILDVA
jgi:hypothetical protein